MQTRNVNALYKTLITRLFQKVSTTRYESWQISGQFSENGVNFYKVFIYNVLELLKITVTKRLSKPPIRKCRRFLLVAVCDICYNEALIFSHIWLMN